jgi:hypothetical protein
MTTLLEGDGQPPPPQPILFAIGTVTKVFSNERAFILSGQEYIVSLDYCFAFSFFTIIYTESQPPKLCALLQDGRSQIYQNTFACTGKVYWHHRQSWRSKG